MREPSAVVFDLDDTLYPERRFARSSCAAVARLVAREYAVPAAATYRLLVSHCRAGNRAGMLQALCEAHGLPDADVARLVETIRAHRPRLRLPASSRTVLAELRQAGHRLGVLTNGLPATQAQKVAVLGVGTLVDAVVYAEACAAGGKPAAACFATVLDRLGVDAAAAVFVGDHPVKDVAGAAAAGMRTIWIDRGTATPPVVPHGIARRLADVPAIVARLMEERHVATH